MDKTQRPPEIKVETDGDDEVLKRESSLLPGMVRTPSRLFGTGINMDWAAPGSTVWDEDAEQPPAQPQTLRTPLTGYGPSSDAWVSTTASPLLGDDTTTAAGAFDDGAAGQQQQLQLTAAGDVGSQAMLGASSAGQVPSAQHRQQPAPHAAHAAMFTTATGAGGPRSGGVTHQPYAEQSNFFTVQEGVVRPAPAAKAGSGGITAAEHHGRHGANAAGGGAGNGLPTLEDKRVAQSIIASAGLPLSVSSLVSYIKDGQPQFDDRHRGHSATGSMGSGGIPDTAIYGTTGANRNYPNLSDPPPGPAGGAYGSCGPQDGYGRPAMPYGQGNSNTSGGEGSGGATALWTGMADQREAGGWNVQASSPGQGPKQPPFQWGPAAGERGHRGYNSHPASGGGRRFSGDAPRGGGPFCGSEFAMPTPAGQGHPIHGVQPGQDGAHPAAGVQSQHQPPMGYGGPHPSAARPKSESEILSDLLHFHANFFPPPPPPRVPHAQKRSRAALWYHYASKWDITHRLPPPPRTPLPEMELEYLMRLPELTRVPYHGEGWLTMSERWFAVTQSLFDFPDENVGVESDVAVVLEQAVIS